MASNRDADAALTGRFQNVRLSFVRKIATPFCSGHGVLTFIADVDRAQP